MTAPNGLEHFQVISRLPKIKPKPMALLSLPDVSISFAEQPLLEEASLQIEPGERLCLIGRNGAGKSTTLKILTCYIVADSGQVSIVGHDVVDLGTFFGSYSSAPCDAQIRTH